MEEPKKKISFNLFEDKAEVVNKEEKIEKGQAVQNEPTIEIPTDIEEKIQVINLDIMLLDEKDKHPFKTDNNFETLKNSIKISGVFDPIKVIRKNNRFEIIEGHRRTRASKELGLSTIPAIVIENNQIDNDIQMVDSNITQRKRFMPSELARAFGIKYRALEKKGISVENINSKEVIAEENNISAKTVQRYLKLDKLTDYYLELIDKNVINNKEGINQATGMAIADLSEEEQNILMEYLEKNMLLPDAEQIKKLIKVRPINEETIKLAFTKKEKIDKRKNIAIPYKKVAMFFDDKQTEDERVDIIIKALEKYFNNDTV